MAIFGRAVRRASVIRLRGLTYLQELALAECMERAVVYLVLDEKNITAKFVRGVGII